jgi:soluble lytic murein transglycosylase-like protein
VKPVTQRIWSLSLRPTSIALGIVIAILLTDSALAVVFGARNASMRREATRIRSRLDSLTAIQETLERRFRVREAILEASNRRIPPEQASLLADEIDRNAQLYQFDPLLILAVVLTESQGRADAVGRFSSGNVSGAMGVMQIKPATARQTARSLGLDATDSTQLMDPAFNLTVGVAYLLQMVHRYSDLRLGIMAYNVGAAGLESALRGEADLPEGYYRKVFAKYRSLRRLAQESKSPAAPKRTRLALAQREGTFPARARAPTANYA